MIRIAVMAMVLFAAGCSTLPATVDIPVAVPCPAPPVIARPRLTVHDLRPDSSPAEVIRAYAESLEAIAGYAESLEEVLDGYRQPGATK